MIKEFLDNINKAVPLEKFDNYLNVPPPTSNHRKKLEEVKLRGIKQVEFNLEVIGEKNFAFTCPGKSESIGYKNYIKSLYLGTEIFGLGKSRSNFVLGAQPIKDLKKGILNLAEKGVVADYSVFQPKKGTKWQEKQVLQLEDIINFSLELSKIYKKYNFKGIYCSLSSRSSIINEVLESHVA
jgi:hypothetical protein